MGNLNMSERCAPVAFSVGVDITLVSLLALHGHAVGRFIALHRRSRITNARLIHIFEETSEKPCYLTYIYVLVSAE